MKLLKQERLKYIAKICPSINILLLITILASCQQNKLSVGKSISSDLYYDSKQNVLEYYQLDQSDTNLIQNVNATAALMYKNTIVGTNERGYELRRRSPYKYNLCSEKDFWHQPGSAFCSGVLVAPDMIVTAGHCIRSEKFCQDKIRFVFDYYNTGTTQKFNETYFVYSKNYTSKQVYNCKEVIENEEDSTLGDFAIIKLDRPVTDRRPIKISSSKSVGPSLYALGFSKGTPLKYSYGGNYTGVPSDNMFSTNLEIFTGNSGGPIVNALTHELEGVLSTTHIYKGQSGTHSVEEFIRDEENKCWQLKSIESDDGMILPAATSKSAFMDYVPDDSARLEVVNVKYNFEGNDSYLSPGKELKVNIELQNISYNNATDVKIEIRKRSNKYSNKKANILIKRSNYDDLTKFQIASNNTPITIRLNDHATCGDFLEFDIIVKFADHQHVRKSFTYPLDIPIGKLVTKQYSASDLPVILESSTFETSIVIDDLNTYIHSISFPVFAKYPSWNQSSLILISPSGKRYFLYNQVSKSYLQGIINEDIEPLSDLSDLVRTSPKGEWKLLFMENMSQEVEFINWGINITTSSCD